LGAFTGSLTYRQYVVREDVPENYRDAYEQSIQKHAFRPLSPTTDAERSIGWCNARFAMDTELDTSKYMYTDYIVLALRVDAWSIPATTLKIYTEAEVQRIMEEQKRESLSRYEVAEIKERVKLELKQRTLPTIKTVDMVWSLQDGIVRFFASSQKMNLDFMDLFEDTFSMSLMPLGVLAALELEETDLSAIERERIEKLDPCVFVDSDAAARAMTEV